MKPQKKRVFKAKSTKKKQFLLTKSWITASILGVSCLELHFNGTEPVNFFGAKSLLGREQFSFGGTSGNLGGTGSECPPWHRACHNVMIVPEVCVHNTEKLLKHANVNFVSGPGVRSIV